MKTLAEIGETLAVERERAGYTQEGLAEKIGVTAVSISRWENGNNMKIDMFQKIVSALGVSADSNLGTEKKDDSIPEMMAALPVKERQIVYQTVTAMISAMLEN